MRTLAIAAAALLIGGAAYAQDTSGASKSHVGNPQAVPGSTGGQVTTQGASKSHATSPKKVTKKKGTQQPATTDKGELPPGKAHGK